MKKILSLFFIAIGFSSFGQGKFETDGRFAPTGNYPITKFGEAQTGYWPLTRITQRDSIPSWQRTYGMIVYVKDTDSSYQLKALSLDNSGWFAFKQGSVDLSAYVPTSRTVNGYPLSSNVTIVKGDVGLGNVPNIDATNPANITQSSSYRFVTDAEKSTWSAKQNALGYTAENTANKGVANGYADLDALGKVPASRLDFGQIGQTFVVASQSAMLAVSNANIGALAIRTDNNRNYRLIGTPASNLSNWQILAEPDAPVQSVNGFTGNVNLLTTHVSEGSNLYWTAARSRAAQSLTTTGSSGAAAYDNSTGVLNIPQYTLSGLGGVPTNGTGATGTWSINISGNAATATLAANSSLLQGYAATASASANTIALRDGFGYLRSVYYYDDNTNILSESITSIYGGNGDKYLYKYSASAVKSFLGLGSYAYRSTGLAELSGAIFTSNVGVNGLIYTGSTYMSAGTIYIYGTGTSGAGAKLLITSANYGFSIEKPNDGLFFGVSRGNGGGPWIQTYNWDLSSNFYGALSVAGNVGIGTTSPINGGSSSKWLTLNSDAGSSYSGGLVHAINGTAVYYGYTSSGYVFHQAMGGYGHKLTVNNNSSAGLTIETTGAASLSNSIDVAGNAMLRSNVYGGDVESNTWNITSAGAGTFSSIKTGSSNSTLIFGNRIATTGFGTKSVLPVSINGTTYYIEVFPGIN